MSIIKVYRWMSTKEFQLFSAGAVLTSKKNHSSTCRTESKGFCFFPETISFSYINPFDGEVRYNEYHATNSMSWLSGIVDADSILLEFEVEESLLETSTGCYADDMTDELCHVIEYYIDSYSCDTFKLISYGYGRVYNDKKKEYKLEMYQVA